MEITANTELQQLLQPDQCQLYKNIEQQLHKAIKIEQLIIKTSQRILYDEEQQQTCTESITKLYNQAFGVKYIGQIPVSSILKKNSQNSFQQQNSLFRTKLSKNDNSEVKLLDTIHNKKYYDLLAIEQGRSLFKSKIKSKYFVMDLNNNQFWPSKYTIKSLLLIYNSNQRSEFAEELLKLAQSFVSYFQKKAILIFQRFLSIDNFIDKFQIPNKPLLTLLINRLYSTIQKINRQHRRILYSIKEVKLNYATALFANRRLIYNSLGYYLDDDLKKQIIQNQHPVLFETFLDTLSFYEQQITEIIKHSQTNGSYQPGSRKWKIYVDNSIGYIQFIFHKDFSQSFGAKQKDDRAVLDLYAMAGRKSDNTGQSIRNLSVKNFKSQKNITSKFQIKQSQQSMLTPKLHHTFQIINVSNISFDSFEFNVLQFDIPTTASLSYQLLTQRFQSLNINQTKLKEFVKQIGANYRGDQNVFHNIYHAFTVLHGAYTLSKSSIFNSLFDQDTTLIYLIAAYCHDVCHTGVTNYFQEKTVSKLSNRYGDISILQNNSIAITLKILSKQQADFMEDFPEKTWKNFRKLLVQSILATDNKNHLQVLTNFQSSMNENIDNLQQQDIQKLIGGLLHTVDFWGTIKDFKVSYQWSKMINIQFQKQYKQQALLQIQQTPYFKDLDNIRVIAKNQQVFISAIVSPLYQKVNEWSKGHLNLALQRISQNIIIWKKLQSGQDSIQNYI